MTSLKRAIDAYDKYAIWATIVGLLLVCSAALSLYTARYPFWPLNADFTLQMSLELFYFGLAIVALCIPGLYQKSSNLFVIWATLLVNVVVLQNLFTAYRKVYTTDNTTLPPNWLDLGILAMNVIIIVVCVYKKPSDTE